MATITKSAEEQLLRICGALFDSLPIAISKRLDDLNSYCTNHTQEGLSEAERGAIDDHIDLEISWATINTDDNPRHVRNEQLHAYKARYRHLPGHVSKRTGIWLPGNRTLEKTTAVVTLDWSPWHPAVEKTKLYLPHTDRHGLYRIKATAAL